jgi:hypothetical protein
MEIFPNIGLICIVLNFVTQILLNYVKIFIITYENMWDCLILNDCN